MPDPRPPTDPDHAYHDRQDPHGRGARLSDVILGGQDGLVNVLGVVLGVAAAARETRIVLAAGLAAAIAESVSMAAVAYTSSRAQGERYESERARELRHVERVPALERAEVRALYESKGLSGELLDRVVDALTSNRELWVRVMMLEEHQLTPVAHSMALRSAWIVGVAAIVGSLVPLFPFVFLPPGPGSWASAAVAAASLFALGAYKGQATLGRPVRAGLELALIGMLSALAGWAVGLAFRV